MPEYFYPIIASAIVILTLLLSLALIYLVFVLRDLSKIVDEVEGTVEKIQDYIMKPISLINHAMKMITPLIESTQKKEGKKK